MLPVFFGALLAFLFLIHVFSLPIKKKKRLYVISLVFCKMILLRF